MPNEVQVTTFIDSILECLDELNTNKDPETQHNSLTTS